MLRSPSSLPDPAYRPQRTLLGAVAAGLLCLGLASLLVAPVATLTTALALGVGYGLRTLSEGRRPRGRRHA